LCACFLLLVVRLWYCITSVGFRTRAFRVTRSPLTVGFHSRHEPHWPRKTLRLRRSWWMGLRNCNCPVFLPPSVSARMVKDCAGKRVYFGSAVHCCICSAALGDFRVAFSGVDCGPLLDYFSIRCVMVKVGLMLTPCSPVAIDIGSAIWPVFSL